MYKKEFDNLLTQNKKFDAYMFYGQSTFLTQYYSMTVALKNTDNKDEIQKIYFDEFDIKYAKDTLLQSSLFSSNNLVLIKLDKPLSKKDTQELIQAANTNSDSTVIFSCMKDSEFKTMAGYFSLKNNSVSVRFFLPSINEAIQLLQKKANNLKLDISSVVLSHLYNMHNFELAFCMSDLEKLSVLNTTITTKIVDNYCFGMGSIDIDNTIFTLLQNKDIAQGLQTILESGINEIVFVNKIADFIQQLIMIRIYMTIHGSRFDSKEIFGYYLPKDIQDKKLTLARKYKIPILNKLLIYIQNIEYDLKTLKLDNQASYIIAKLKGLRFV
jgi:DNA polymerase-3 subunit delta